LLPVRGIAAVWTQYAADFAIAPLFFLHGAKLSWPAPNRPENAMHAVVECRFRI
jgi:hypothetical protein